MVCHEGKIHFKKERPGGVWGAVLRVENFTFKIQTTLPKIIYKTFLGLIRSFTVRRTISVHQMARSLATDTKTGRYHVAFIYRFNTD